LSKESLLHVKLASHEYWQIKQQISALKQLKILYLKQAG